MAQSTLDSARTSLVDAVRKAVPAVRQSRSTGHANVVPPEEGDVTAATLGLLGALHAAGALEQRSKRILTDLPVSNGEFGELVVAFKPNEPPALVRQNGEPAGKFAPDAGGTSLLLLAVADRLAREVSAGNFWHDKSDLTAAIDLLQQQGKALQAERR